MRIDTKESLHASGHKRSCGFTLGPDVFFLE
jgi:hypothetical protein